MLHQNSLQWLILNDRARKRSLEKESKLLKNIQPAPLKTTTTTFKKERATSVTHIPPGSSPAKSPSPHPYVLPPNMRTSLYQAMN
jgi:hypothetical protein